MEEKKKRGRPAGKVLTNNIRLRLDDEMNFILTEYTKIKSVSKSEALRHGILKLKEEIEKPE